MVDHFDPVIHGQCRRIARLETYINELEVCRQALDRRYEKARSEQDEELSIARVLLAEAHETLARFQIDRQAIQPRRRLRRRCRGVRFWLPVWRPSRPAQQVDSDTA